MSWPPSRVTGGRDSGSSRLALALGRSVCQEGPAEEGGASHPRSTVTNGYVWLKTPRAPGSRREQRERTSWREGQDRLRGAPAAPPSIAGTDCREQPRRVAGPWSLTPVPSLPLRTTPPHAASRGAIPRACRCRGPLAALGRRRLPRRAELQG